MAQHLSLQVNQSSLEHAIDLEPHNADYHDLLGRYLLFNTDNPIAAATAIRQAVSLNPYAASYWLDLAQADLSSGASQEEQQAISRALAAEPTTPEVAWNVANLLVFQGDINDALPHYAVVLQHSPGLVHASLGQCWRLLHDTGRILPILPPDPEVYLQLVHLLTSEKESVAAAQTWAALSHLDKGFDYHDGLFYVDYLLEIRKVDAAVDAWHELASRSPKLGSYHKPGNLISDGIFSREILNAGFDWHYSPSIGTSLSLDRSEFYGIGSERSISIDYAGVGSDTGLHQEVAIEPDTLYRLSAWVKSDALQSANGPTVGATEAYSNTKYAMTGGTLGTTDWHEVWVDFKSGPAARLVSIRILRNPEDTVIRGKFWVDDIKLYAIDHPESASK